MKTSFLSLALISAAAASCAAADAAPAPRSASLAVPYAAETARVVSHTDVPEQHSQLAQALRAAIWIEGDQDVFRRGDRVQLRFRTSQTAYVAVVHLDTDGSLELLYPTDPWDDGYVRGQRVYSLPATQWNTRWTIGSNSGIGYFYLLASPDPLDLRYFQSRVGGGWDSYSSRRLVRGDPFWALRNLSELLVPDWEYTPFVEDVYTYHVDQRHSYPAFACYDRASGFGRVSDYGYYDSCDRVSGLLQHYPHYYDTRRYRGDRQVYLRELGGTSPRHGFKERADLPDRRASPSQDRSAIGLPRTRSDVPPRGAPVLPRSRAEPTDRPQPVAPDRRRPTLERRPPEREAARPSPPPASAEKPRVEERQPEERRPPSSRTAKPSARPPGG
jgi:hypothetical protein